MEEKYLSGMDLIYENITNICDMFSRSVDLMPCLSPVKTSGGV